jgi:hypothetical protein
MDVVAQIMFKQKLIGQSMEMLTIVVKKVQQSSITQGAVGTRILFWKVSIV